MSHPEATYYKRYIFPLRNVTPELITYLLELKETVSRSPWFGAIIFRSLLEEDDRAAAHRELANQFKVVLPSWNTYAFLLMVKLKEPYHVKVVSPEDIHLVRRGETLLEDPLMMMTDTIPHKARAQWETLTTLVTLSNQRVR